MDNNVFDTALGKIKDFANAAGKKTEEVVEISKLKISKAQTNSDLQKAFERLGRVYYEMRTDEADYSDIVKVSIAEINELKAKLEDIDEKYAQVKQVIRCKKCGGFCARDSLYCARCGTPLQPKDTQETEQEKPSVDNAKE